MISRPRRLTRLNFKQMADRKPFMSKGVIVRYSFFILPEHPDGLYGVVVSKKTCASAVKRVLIKRRIREILRKQQLPHNVVVVARATASAIAATHQDLAAEYHTAIVSMQAIVH